MLKYCIRSLLNGHKIIPTEIDAIFYLVLSDFLNNIFSNIETDSNYFSSDSLNHEKKMKCSIFPRIARRMSEPWAFLFYFLSSLQLDLK